MTGNAGLLSMLARIQKLEQRLNRIETREQKYWMGWLPLATYGALLENITTAQYVLSGSVTRDLTIIDYYQMVHVITTNNGSNYWLITLYESDGTTISSLSTSALSPDTTTLLSDVGIDHSIGTAEIGVYIRAVMVGSPGTLRLYGPGIWVEYRS